MQTDHWFIFHENQLVLHKIQDKLVPVKASHDFSAPAYYLDISTENLPNVYCAELSNDYPELPANFELVSLRQSLNILDPTWYGMAVRAYTVLQWDKNHRYCGRCGHATEHKSKTFERICTSCKLPVYPRISPSMIVRIRRGDKILMARSPHFAPGTYGLIAGFVEAGESLEETIHREVMEEVGLKIKNIEYFSSQPWPFPDSLMIGFTADYESGEIKIDNVEIEDANWYRKDEIPGWPRSSVSISQKLVEDFVKSS